MLNTNAMTVFKYTAMYIIRNGLYGCGPLVLDHYEHCKLLFWFVTASNLQYHSFKVSHFRFNLSVVFLAGGVWSHGANTRVGQRAMVSTIDCFQ